MMLYCQQQKSIFGVTRCWMFTIQLQSTMVQNHEKRSCRSQIIQRGKRRAPAVSRRGASESEQPHQQDPARLPQG